LFLVKIKLNLNSFNAKRSEQDAIKQIVIAISARTFDAICGNEVSTVNVAELLTSIQNSCEHGYVFIRT
jgi:hypothetical protein